MKKIFSAVLGGCLLLGACAATEQKTITIKGKVQFLTIALTWRLWNGTVLTRPLSTPVK